MKSGSDSTDTASVDATEAGRTELTITGRLLEMIGLSAGIGSDCADLAGLEAKISLQALIQYSAVINAVALFLVLLWSTVTAALCWWLARHLHGLAAVLGLIASSTLLLLLIRHRLRALSGLIGFPRTRAFLKQQPLR